MTYDLASRAFVLSIILLVLALFTSISVALADTLDCGGEKLCMGTKIADVMVGDNTSNSMSGLGGIDDMIGIGGDDNMSGNDLADRMIGGEGDDTIAGGNGSDEIIGSTGNDDISGGYGADEIIGGEGNDTIFGDAGGDTIMGGPTDDVIVGEMGTDVMNGQDGDDKIYHAFLNSTVSDGSKDLVICGDGQDEVWINFSVDGDQVSDDCESIHRG
jgi:Ca2+-binding RTX toxin-like protein